MLAGASTWLASWGSDQWQYPPPVDVIDRDLKRGALYVVTRNDNGEVVASATIDTHADPDFWVSEDHPDDALYIHKMAVDRRWSGRRLGGALLDFAAELAEERERSWVRLDAWKTNPELHRYYTSQGFTLLRIVDLLHRQSGALFQRDAKVRRSGVSLRRQSP
ncbi:ribosomal protein S18 acetylase RimI-like enzyme [Lipingzhangella halophila]|uniref:Ribosomal protein S18 acetylase RimI-like enzyme n=1 Tax=Lipingzhangella halophila TaxID=1783352 RepID=A0A7W7RMF1_9ACTN|nr:GNAT family N-acetyltransferase [Lipingzhangella halophila]MBB4929205.1 ribosomal protein S18 acetylase RimI-like enzyme [Lipingzhangella halophila]MBB4934698.1 ribosomal protein S18 acetylase RimI-like enzyme [Lipingzhangella halophila]